MTTNLTDRYVAATLRRVPERHRPDIERELRAAIADDVDARLANGGSDKDAEFGVLRDLGDPIRLAAGYSNRSLTLIGPDLYPSYVRSLTVLGLATLPALAAVLVVVSAAQGRGFWASIFGPLGVTLTVAVYLAFVVTVLFAVAERRNQSRPLADISRHAWTPDELVADDERPRVPGWGDVATTIVGTALLITLVFLDRYLPIVRTSHGHPVSVLAPLLWAFWIPLFFALRGLDIVLEIVKVRVGHWSVGAAVVTTMLGFTAAGALITMVLTTTVVNPALATAPFLVAGSWMWWTVATLVAIVYLAALIPVWRPARRGH